MLDVQGTWLNAEDRQLLRQPEVGGLILFARNIEHPAQVRELCAQVRVLRDDLVIAVDQEGGRVQRLRQGFVSLPAMGRLAELPQSAKLAEAVGWVMASEVLAAGLDFSFAPVLDLNIGRSAVIGQRAFAADAELVTELAGAFIRGMGQAGMSAVGKHFPGHGWAEADSHVAIPVDERHLDEIRASDLKPFAQLASVLAGVMPAHVIYPAVAPGPAGFSKRWLQEILRGELGFQGVIFSDDLSMAGAHVAGDAAARIEAALAAGCDMGLVCNDRAAAEQALTALQRLGITPGRKHLTMRSRVTADLEYKRQPCWLQAMAILRDAGLMV